MLPNSRRSTLANAGCFLEDLEPNAANVNSSRTDLSSESSEKNSSHSNGGDSNQLLSNNDPDGCGSRQQRANSATSFASTLSLNGDFCKICHCGGEPQSPLITPCFCSGSLKHVHQECLQKWIKSSDIKRCELCKYPFSMQSKVKPFCQWEKLDMSSIERRKLLCSVTFHIVAITCVVWSLYILIDRTADEIKVGDLKWPFWTKLVVVAIGFTGGLVFMYIQCKVYVHLCRKWKAYNRIIVVQEAPEGLHKPSSQSKAESTQNQINKDEESFQSEFRRPSLVFQSTIATATTTTTLTTTTTTTLIANKSNAETQTALRGVSIVPTSEMKIYREIDNDCLSTKSQTGIPVGGATAFFFADCECTDGKAYSISSSHSPSLSAPSSRSGTIRSSKKQNSSGRKSGRGRRASESTYSASGPDRSKGELPGSPIDSVLSKNENKKDNKEDGDCEIEKSEKVLPPLKRII